MIVLRILSVLIGAVILVVGVYLIGMRFADGPNALAAGGPLVAGDLVTEEPDWSFARDVMEIELQLMTPPRSRTVWMAEHEGTLYVPCGYMDSWWGRLWKQWPAEAREDPRAVVRIEGKRYERTLVPVTAADPEAGPVLAELARKYGFPGVPPAATLSSEALLLYKLAPRVADAAAASG